MKRPCGCFLAYLMLWILSAPFGALAQTGEVIVPAKEFQTLRAQAEELQKLRNAPRPAPPSECRLVVRIDSPTRPALATIQATYIYQSPQTRLPILLGGKGAQPRSAKYGDGRPASLSFESEQLVLLTDQIGPGELIVEWESPILTRSAGAEVGLEMALPRAAITILTVENLPRNGQGVTAATRTGDPQRIAYRPGVALGPAEVLDLTWPTSFSLSTEVTPSVESEIVVRVEENRIETTAKLRLKGGAREWPLFLPFGSDVSVERTSPVTDFGGVGPTISRPADAARPLWTINVPKGGSDWMLTVVHRQPRSRTTDPKARQVITVGPFSTTGTTRNSGTLRIEAPPLVRVTLKSGPDLRRLDLPANSNDEIQALFRLTPPPVLASRNPSPLAELELRPVRGFIRVEPTYRMQLTRVGWRFHADLRVIPVRSEVDTLLLEWPGVAPGVVEASAVRPVAADGNPVELIADVEVLRETNPRTLAIRLETPQKGPFELTLSASFPLPATTRNFALTLPNYPQLSEQSTRLTITVPDGIELQGTATARDNDMVEVRPTVASTTNLVFEPGLARVELAWQPYRPGLTVRSQVEIELGERQAKIAQTVTLRLADEGAWRSVRFRAPAGALGIQAPGLEAISPGEWELIPSTNLPRELTQVLTFAVPIPTRPSDKQSTRLDVPLFWVEEATRTDTTVRLWGSTGARRVLRFDGPWREIPSELDTNRDAWPWLVLAGNGDRLKLGFDLLDPSDSPIPQLWIERALIRARLSPEDQITVVSQFLIRRWGLSPVEIRLPKGVTPRIAVDGRPVENILPTSDDTIRVPLRDPKTGSPWLRLEITYTQPLAKTLWGSFCIDPPEFLRTAFRSSIRWQIACPKSSILVLSSEQARPDILWSWRQGSFGPLAAATDAELEAWLLAPMETMPTISTSSTGKEALTLRQATLTPLTFYRISNTLWIISHSLLALALLIITAYLPAILRSVLIGMLIIMLSILYLLFPQPISESLSAVQPGFIAGLGTIIALMAWQRMAQRRITHLPGFTRVGPTLTPSPSQQSVQPVANGSAAQNPRVGTTTSIPSVAYPGVESQPKI